MNAQPGILASVPRRGRYLFFKMVQNCVSKPEIKNLCQAVVNEKTVVGLGQSLVIALDGEIPRLRTFPAIAGRGIDIPSTPFALMCWLQGDDQGELLHRGRAIRNTLAPGFDLVQAIDSFQYGPSLDLTGYEDGTENPQDDDAVKTAILDGEGPGLDGSSFVAVQKWVHDLDRFEAKSQEDQDNTIGRRKSDNEELDDAPDSAHVKRTAQESFEPEAFILRRSMPWADGSGEGLVFVAFGKSFDAFEALLRRMVGNEDGVPDALFSFTRPVTGSYFWCPPMTGAQLDLSALGQ